MLFYWNVLFMQIALTFAITDRERVRILTTNHPLVMQITLTLAIAEEALEFEHRDLHWGNVLVQPASSTVLNVRLRGVDIEVRPEGKGSMPG